MDLHDLNALKVNQPDFNENRYPTSNGAHPDTINNTQSTPPNPPPRDNQQTQRSIPGYGNFNQNSYGASPMFNSFSNTSGYNTYGHNGFSSPYSSSMMNSAGGYGIGQNSNGFLRSAEDSSRGAFQSIESVVSAFTAVAAMFESTYFAVYNSFRAVVGVADQFHRLKTQLSSILSAFALVRFFKYILRKLIRIIRLGRVSANVSEILTNTDSVWSIAEKYNDAEKLVMESKKSSTNWPLIMFFGVVFGGPWLIWKILSSVDVNSKDNSLWMTGKIDHFIAVSEFDYDSLNVDELSFKRGHRIIIAPKEYQPNVRGWLLGSVDGTTHGIMPANYLKIMGKKQGENSKIEQNRLNVINELPKQENLDAIFEDKGF